MSKNILFEGIENNALQQTLLCLGAFERDCKKGEYLLTCGDKPQCIYIVLSGGLSAESTDLSGNTGLISHITEGGIFGGAFAFTDGTVPLDLRATEKSRVLCLPVQKLLTPCSNACGAHNRIVANLIKVLAAKSVSLLTKISHISARGIRGKVIAYLSSMEKQGNNGVIQIDLNRQQLADYLEVDRCALSRELSLMKKEGLIDYSKNRFVMIGQKLK